MRENFPDQVDQVEHPGTKHGVSVGFEHGFQSEKFVLKPTLRCSTGGGERREDWALEGIGWSGSSIDWSKAGRVILCFALMPGSPIEFSTEGEIAAPVHIVVEVVGALGDPRQLHGVEDHRDLVRGMTFLG